MYLFHNQWHFQFNETGDSDSGANAGTNLNEVNNNFSGPWLPYL